MTDYVEAVPGEWLHVWKRYMRDSCCDCGLVHKHEYRIVGNQIQMRSWRDNRATAANRRRKKYRERLPRELLK